MQEQQQQAPVAGLQQASPSPQQPPDPSPLLLQQQQQQRLPAEPQQQLTCSVRQQKQQQQSLLGDEVVSPSLSSSWISEQQTDTSASQQQQQPMPLQQQQQELPPQPRRAEQQQQQGQVVSQQLRQAAVQKQQQQEDGQQQGSALQAQMKLRQQHAEEEQQLQQRPEGEQQLQQQERDTRKKEAEEQQQRGEAEQQVLLAEQQHSLLCQSKQKEKLPATRQQQSCLCKSIETLRPAWQQQLTYIHGEQQQQLLLELPQRLPEQIQQQHHQRHRRQQQWQQQPEQQQHGPQYKRSLPQQQQQPSDGLSPSDCLAPRPCRVRQIALQQQQQQPEVLSPLQQQQHPHECVRLQNDPCSYVSHEKQEQKPQQQQKQQQPVWCPHHVLRVEQQHSALPPVLKAKAAPEKKAVPRSEAYKPRPHLLRYAPPPPRVQEPEKPVETAAAAPAAASARAAAGPPPVMGVQPRQKQREARVFEEEPLQDPSKRDVGSVLRNQKPLVRREMYRRRLFPVGFEYAATTVTEAEVLLGDRPNIVEAVAFLLHLVSFILFATVNTDVSLLFAVHASLQRALEEAPASLSSSGYSSISAAAAAQPAATASLLQASPNMLLQLRSLKTKTDVASWLLDGLLSAAAFPNLGTASLPASQTPQTRGGRGRRAAEDPDAAGEGGGGGHVICGPCMRLTVQQVKYGFVADSPLGYRWVWPAAARRGGTTRGWSSSPHASIAAQHLLSAPTISSSQGSRLKWTYSYAAPFSPEAFFRRGGGYYQFICAADAAAAQRTLQQQQPRSRYPPFFVPNAFISHRRTTSVAVDFITVEPYALSTSYIAIVFQFDSAGSLLPVNVSISTSLGRKQHSAGLRYGSLGAAVVLLLLHVGYQLLRLRRMHSWQQYAADWWRLFGCLQLLLVLLSLIFFGLTYLPHNIPAVSRQQSEDGSSYVPQSSLLQADMQQQLNEVGAAVAASAAAAQRFASAAAIAIVAGCVLMIRYLQIFGGTAAKTMDWTLKKLLPPVITCILFFLVVLLLFVTIGNISLGAEDTAFSGFYSSLITSAAYIVGGAAGNFPAYNAIEDSAIFAALFFVPLFVLFCFLFFNVLAALVLKTYDVCAAEMQRSLARQQSSEDRARELRRTRPERMQQGAKNFLRALCEGLAWQQLVEGGEEQLIAAAGEDLDEGGKGLLRRRRKRRKAAAEAPQDRNIFAEAEGEEEEEDEMRPPRYPDWLWSDMGMQNPYSMQGFIDPQAAAAYYQQYGAGASVNAYTAAQQYQSLYYYYPQQLDAAYCMQPGLGEAVPSMAGVHSVLQYAQGTEEEMAWHQIACIVFIIAVAVLVGMQNMLSLSRGMQQSVEAALAQTTWLPPMREILFEDPSLGLAPLRVYVAAEPRSFSSIATVNDVHEWLSSPTGLTFFLINTSSPSQYKEVFHSNLTAFKDQPYYPFLVNNWNAMLTPLPVRLRLHLLSSSSISPELTSPLKSIFLPADSGNTTLFDYYIHATTDATALHEELQRISRMQPFRDVVQQLSISFGLYNNNMQQNQYSSCCISFTKATTAQAEAEAAGIVQTEVQVNSIGLQPYDLNRRPRVAQLALQAMILLIVLCFIVAGIVGFYRFCRSYPSERVDTHPWLTCSVYFIDHLFNFFDVLLLFCFLAAVLAWVTFYMSPAQSVIFTNGFRSYLSGTVEMQYRSLGTVQSSFSSAYAAVEAYAQICGTLIVLASLRLLRPFEKKKRVVTLLFTVTEAMEQLLYVFFLVFFLFVGLAFMCYLSFGHSANSFSTVQKSFVGSFLLLLGSFPVEEVFHANLPVAAFTIFPILFFVGVICLACFLCVLLRSFFIRVAEVDKAEALLQQQRGFTKEGPLSGLRLCCRQLLCMRKKNIEDLSLKAAGVSRNLALAGGHDADAGTYHLTAQHQQLLADDEESLDEFEEMKKIDLLARRARQKPVKVAEIPREVITSQLTDEQWRTLPVQICSWAQSEVENFNEFFRKLHILSALAGKEKLPFVQQVEVDLYNQLTTRDKEVQQQEALLNNRLSIYKNRTIHEQEKLANYTKYLERALEDREREIEMLKNEVSLVQNKTRELTGDQRLGPANESI